MRAAMRLPVATPTTLFQAGIDMKCVRCEIVRAKLRATILFSLGTDIDDIVTDLNIAYSGVYMAQWLRDEVQIRRLPSEIVAESELIFSAKTERKLNQDAIAA